MAAIGIVVNPASGKDVRRLVARASVFDNREKCALVRRAVVGAANAGAREFIYLDDSHNIAGSAFEELGGKLSVTKLPCAGTGSALDTQTGAEALRGSCAVALVLGGDGTSRAFVKGWRDCALLPLSTGTNNVFPQLVEATVAGAALGVLASGGVAAQEALQRVKIIDVEIEGEAPDLALIDAVATRDRFIGARALLDGGAIDSILLTRAEPMAVGMTAVGGLVRPLADKEDAGLFIKMGEAGGQKVHAPIAPGLYETLHISQCQLLPLDATVSLRGPCVLAFDGEREREIQAGQEVRMKVSRTGPSVLNIAKVMQLAACRGLFQ